MLRAIVCISMHRKNGPEPNRALLLILPLMLTLFAIFSGSIQAKEAVKGFGDTANIPTEEDISLPPGAVVALVKTPWLQKFFHDPTEIRMQSRFLPAGLRMNVGHRPVVLDDRLRAPGDDFARLEITAVEEVKLFGGYAVSFRYPSEGVIGNLLLVPEGKGWRVMTVDGGER